MLVQGLSGAIPQIKIKTEKASLLMEEEPASVQITRERGGLEIEYHPIQLDIDNRAFFDSLGLKPISALAGDLVAQSKKAVLDSIARSGQEAKLLGAPHNKEAFSQISQMRLEVSTDTILAFIPEEPTLNWTKGWLDISYTPDELNFQWDKGGVKQTYLPYSVDITVEER